MSFDLAVRFSGLLHYVSNNGAGAVRLCVVLPEAPNHRAVMLAVTGCRLTRNGVSVQEDIEFSGSRVAFRFDREGSTEDLPAFDFEGPAMGGDVKGAVPLERMIEELADDNPRIVSAAASREEDGVRAQILIEEGVTFSLPPNPLPPAVRLPDGEILPMSPFVLMDCGRLSGAEILVMPLASSSLSDAVSYRVEPVGSGPARLAISHLCPPEMENGETDNDFRFHYLLLNRQSRSLALSGTLPVPRIVRFIDEEEDSSPSSSFLHSFRAEPAFRIELYDLRIRGCNCSPAHGRGRRIALDDFNTQALLRSDRRSPAVPRRAQEEGGEKEQPPQPEGDRGPLS